MVILFEVLAQKKFVELRIGSYCAFGAAGDRARSPFTRVLVINFTVSLLPTPIAVHYFAV